MPDEYRQLNETILEAAGEGIYGLDQQGTVTFINPAAARMLGWEAQELVGRRMHEEAHHSRADGSPYPASECPLYETLRDGEVHRAADEVFWRADGTSFPVQYTATPVIEDGVLTGAVVSFSDITERKRAEAALRKSEERQALLLELSDRLRPLADAAEIQGEACRLLAERLDASRAYYVEVDEAADTVRVERDFVRGDTSSLAGEHRVADFAWSVAILRRGECHVIADTQTSDLVPVADRPASAALGIIACMGAPLIKGGRLVGALCVTDGRPREWSESEVALLREVGARIWAAVERARAEEALAASEEKYRSLFDSIDEGVTTIEMIFDDEERAVDFVYLDHNPALTRMTGVTDDIIGKRVSEVVPDPELFWLETYGRVVKTGEPVRFEASVKDLDRWFDVHASRVGGEGSRKVVVVYNNINERKRREASMAFLNEVSQDLVQLTDIDETMNTIGEKIGAHFGLSAALFAELVDAAQIGVINHGWHRADMPSLLGTYRMEEFVEPEVLERCRAGEAVVIRDVFVDPMTDGEQYAALNIGSFVSIPLVRDGEWRFLLVVYRTERYDWRDDEIELIRELASRIWTRLERARAEEQVREREERLELATGAAELGIWELDLATNASPVRSERHDEIFGYGEPLEEWSFEIFLDHVHPEDRGRIQRSFEAALRMGAWEFECRIIRADGEQRWISAQGKFYFDKGEPVRAVGTVQDVTGRARAEAERDRIEAEREQTRQRTAFLSEASRRLAESLDWEQTLSEIARLAVPSICDLCIVDTLGAPGEAKSVRRLAAAHHDPEKERLAWELEKRYPVSEDPKSAVAEVIRTAEPVLLTEVTEDWLQYVSQDEGQRQLLEELGLGSMVIVPLAIHGRTFGALTLAYDGSGRRYGEEDLTLASDLGRRAAQAMDNARLYEEQSHAARILQQSLLPPSLPEIPGVQTAVRFKPAASAGGRATGGYDVGGDFYDLFQTPTGWAAVVGDVAGKGVEAAQLTSMARYTLRASAMDGESPSNVVSKLNAAMLNQRSDSKFCTLAYGLLNHFDGDSHDGDSHDGGAGTVVRLRLCRGGHPPPLILRADGAIEEAGLTGKLVGAIQQASFEDLDVDLGCGDAVIFYTDGVTEARDPEGELFGDERLKALAKALAGACKGLDAEEIADGLEDGIVEFQNGAAARDDVALLVLKTS